MVKTPHESTRILRKLWALQQNARAERMLLRMRPADRGPLLAELSPPELRRAVDLLFARRLAAQSLREMPPELLPGIFDALGHARVAKIFARLAPDDLVELAGRLSAHQREAVLQLLPAEQRQALLRAERHPPESAGRAMVTKFLALPEQATAQQAIERIRSHASDDEALLYLYVVDARGRLRGTVPLRRLVAAPPQCACAKLMVREPVSVRADADREEAARLVARHNLLAIPVLEDDGRLAGVITVDDVIEVINEEATEDIYRLAGLHENERVFSPMRFAVAKRLPWMLLNLGALFLAAWVVGLFERALSEVVALAFFMPVVAGMGGTGGIQALTVITRAIALGELEFSSGLRAVGKEFGAACAIGAVTGLASGVLAALWQGSPLLGAVLFGTMLLTMAVAGALGAAVPLLLKAWGQDPAAGSGVLVVTLTDLFGFAVFLGIGTLLLERIS